MKKWLNERYIVAILFILVMISFSLAQEQSRSMQHAYSGTFTVKTQQHNNAPVKGGNNEGQIAATQHNY